MPVSGAILVLGTVAGSGLPAAVKASQLEGVLSLEEMISDLLKWRDAFYTQLVAQRSTWCQNLFQKLVVC